MKENELDSCLSDLVLKTFPALFPNFGIDTMKNIILTIRPKSHLFHSEMFQRSVFEGLVWKAAEHRGSGHSSYSAAPGSKLISPKYFLLHF